MENQEKYLDKMESRILNKIDEGFTGIEKKINEIVSSSEDRFCKIDERINKRIKESDKNQKNLSDQIGIIRGELKSTKDIFKGVCIVLSIIWGVVTFIAPHVWK
ncbi:MAG: hypothetical protein PHQ46_10705 [Negativicutes bacterium]|nr:hypothetical protein [Negativicutes bacterium]